MSLILILINRFLKGGIKKLESVRNKKKAISAKDKKESKISIKSARAALIFKSSTEIFNM